MADTMSSIELGLMNMMYQLQTFSILTATFNGIVLWELVTCFPEEAKHIFWPELKNCASRMQLPSLGSVLLFNARILSIPLVGISYQMIAPDARLGISVDFNALFRAYIFLFSAAVFNGTAVFVIRTLAIRDSGRPMTIFLWSCYAVVCIFHLVCAVLVKKPISFLSYTPSPSSLDQYLPWAVFVGCAIAFDSLVLALSIAPQLEGFKWKPTYSQVAKRFYFDAVTYFGLSLVVSVFDFIWVHHHRKDGILVALATPIHIWLTVTISPRVIRNLRLHTVKQKQKTGAAAEIPVTQSPFSSESDLFPHTACSDSQVGPHASDVEIMSGERPALYLSTLYSNSSRGNTRI